MPLVLVGINHKQAGIELREKLALKAEEMEGALGYLLQQEEVEECFLFSTCNRTELYSICSESDSLRRHFFALFRQVKEGGLRSTAESLCYVMEEEEAVRHLFRVACGLDSMVLGETQILGQIKEAYHRCAALKSTGVYLHNLCQKALAAGKKVHTHTALGQHAVSFGYAAAELAREIFAAQGAQTLMVIGTGEMAALTLQNLFELGAGEIIIATRQREKGEALAARFSGKTLSLTRLEEGLKKANVIICATNAPHHIITTKRLKPLLEQKKRGPLLIIDLGVPRNVEPAVGTLEKVHLYNLDDIQFIIARNLEARRAEAEKAEAIIWSEVVDFTRWYRRQRAAPFIAALRQKAEKIRREKLQQFAPHLSALSTKEQETVEKLTRSLVNQLVRDPVLNMKDLSAQPGYELLEKQAYLLFGLEKELPVKKVKGERRPDGRGSALEQFGRD
jgi:glutamyl-tRNA reductase